MIGLLTAVQVLIALVLILIVLLQDPKGTDVGSAFGGMGSQATFGPRGTATFLSKATVGLAVVFMVTSVALSILGREANGAGQSVLSNEETAPAATETAPATPNAPAAAAEESPAAKVGTEGMGGMKATVTVENPGDEPAPSAPAATATPGSATAPAPATPSNEAVPAPANQPPN